jgi:hypothetical protein
MLVARSPRAMAEHPIGPVLTGCGWATIALVTAVSFYIVVGRALGG